MNPYELLKIPMNATPDQRNTAFCNLAEAAFPSITPDNPNALNYFFDLVDAFNILSDQWSKYELDTQLMNGTYNPGSRYENYTHTDGFVPYSAKDLIYVLGEIQRTSEKAKSDAKKYGLTGLAWFVGGLVVTIASAAAGAGVLAWGAILFGGIEAVKGLSEYFKVGGKVRKVKEKFWADYLRVSQPAQQQQQVQQQ